MYGSFRQFELIKAFVVDGGQFVFGNGTGEWANCNGSGKCTATGHAVNA
jgi:hypothetical protein